MPSASARESLANRLHPKTMGRPKNVFTMSPGNFKTWFKTRHWQEVKGLKMLLAEGGAYGLFSEDGKYSIELRTVARNDNYAYVRLLSRDGALDFGWPAVLDLKDMADLFIHWEALSFLWTESFKSLQETFPLGEWKLAAVTSVPSPDVVWVCSLEQQSGQNALALVQRAGWASYFSKSDPTKKLIGLCGTAVTDIEPIITAAKAEGIRLFPNVPVTFNQKLYNAMLAASAGYTKRQLLTVPPGFGDPYLPHAALLNRDLKFVPGFKL